MAPGGQRQVSGGRPVLVMALALLAGCAAMTEGAGPVDDLPPDATPVPVDTAAMPPWAARDLEAALAAGVDEPDPDLLANDATAAAEPAAEPAADGDAVETAKEAGGDALARQRQALREARPTHAVVQRPIELPEGLAWRTYAARLLTAGRTGLALKAYERALAEGGADLAVLTGAGIAAMGQGQNALAEHYLRAALAEAPQGAAPNLAMGRLLMRTGQLEPARTHLRTAFLVTSGQNELAVESLKEVERRIVARRALYLPTVDREQAVTLSTLRTGPSTYLLGRPATGTAARVEDLEEAAVPADALLPEDAGAADDAETGDETALAPQAEVETPPDGSTASTDASPDGTVRPGDDEIADQTAGAAPSESAAADAAE